MKVKCIIVDDEPISRDILKKYMKDLPLLELVAECSDAFEASEALSKHEIDLVFLDINMPRLSGISFAKSLRNAPSIIFTTAYPEYAVDGFDLNAIDYLVKPFSLERFIKAINKALDKLQKDKADEYKTENIILRSEKRIYSIPRNSIEYIEGCGDYIKVCLHDNKKLIVHQTLKNFTSSLPQNEFMRVHKSYSVRIKAIEYIKGNMAYIGKITVPISPAQKTELLQIFQA